MHVTSHVFAEITHVVAAPCGFACVVIPHIVIYSMFHPNPFRGLGAPGCRNLPIPITFAIGFYNSLHWRGSNSLHFRASREVAKSPYV